MGKLIENVGFSHRYLMITPLICDTCVVPVILSFALLQYHRTSPYDAILGGAEDVLGDLGVRQAMKKMPKNARL